MICAKVDEFPMSAVPTVIFGENHLGAMKNQRCNGISVVSGRVITGFQCNFIF